MNTLLIPGLRSSEKKITQVEQVLEDRIFPLEQSDLWIFCFWQSEGGNSLTSIISGS